MKKKGPLYLHDPFSDALPSFMRVKVSNRWHLLVSEELLMRSDKFLRPLAPREAISPCLLQDTQLWPVVSSLNTKHYFPASLLAWLWRSQVDFYLCSSVRSCFSLCLI